MKSKVSFFNVGIIRNDIKNYGWIAGAYLLALLLSTPLRILMIYTHQQELNYDFYPSAYVFNGYLNVFEFRSAPFLLLLTMAVPVLTGVLLFQYLQNSRAADSLHTLPVKRQVLYNSHVLTGGLFLIIPLIITALVSWALATGLEIESLNGAIILKWLTVAALFNLLFFAVSVGVGMFTGMSTAQFVLTYIVLLLPSGLLALATHNLSFYWAGFPISYIDPQLDISPLIRLADYSSQNPLSITEMAAYILSAVFILWLGRKVYQKRDLEMASHALVFPVLHPIFVYGVAFCSMLLLGSYFYKAQNSLSWTYFAYLLGSGLGFFLAKIIISKSIKVFNLINLRHYAYFIGTVLLLGAAVRFDLFNYQKDIPLLADIESVYMDQSFFMLDYQPKVQVSYYTNDWGEFVFYENVNPYKINQKPIYKEADSIAAVHALHQRIIENLDEFKPQHSRRYDPQKINICLAYKLKNGSMFYRQYHNVSLDKFAAELKPIYESAEHKYLHYNILKVNPDAIKALTINAYNTNRSVKITDAELIETALTMLKSDILNMSYEDIISSLPGWADINLLLDNNYSLNLTWEKSYKNFGKWLQAVGQYHKARIIPEDIEYALIERYLPGQNPAASEKYPVVQNPKEYILELEKQGIEYYQVSSAEQLEKCLVNYLEESREAAYKITFFLKNGQYFGGYFPDISFLG